MRLIMKKFGLILNSRPAGREAVMRLKQIANGTQDNEFVFEHQLLSGGNMNRKKIWRIGSGLLSALFLSCIIAGCGIFQSNSQQYVTISTAGKYLQVAIDYSTGDRYSIGREYGLKVKAALPDYEQWADSYLSEIAAGKALSLDEMVRRALEIKSQIDPDYLNEINGFASVLSGKDHDELGDGKLSINEYLILNLMPDIATNFSCSDLAVYGARSATGKTIIGRNTEWYVSSRGLLEGASAIIHTTLGSKQVVSFGWVGIVGCLVAVNNDGVFVANLYSPIGGAYEASGRSSVMLDIRKVMETCSTVDEAANYLKDPAKLYTYNNNMFIADRTTAKVLENNFNNNRALRTESSLLNPGITWEFANAVACVNSFLLSGNTDNHTGNTANTNRWANYRGLLGSSEAAVDFERMKTIMSYHQPGTGGYDKGDIYRSTTVQSLVYSFDDNRLEVWLHPQTGSFTDSPQYTVITMPFQP